MTDFDKAFELVVGLEGGYSNDPKDPGGETKYGITKRQFPNLDIKNLTPDQAKAIYAESYWAALKCGELPWPLNLYLFDAGVNQGVPTAARLLQKSVGVAQDGILGFGTMKAVLNSDQKELAAKFMADRALAYTGTRNFDNYGRGWLKRLFAITMET